jgi:hypothetical protein
MLLSGYMKLPLGKMFSVCGVALFLFGMGIVLGWTAASWIGGSRLKGTEFPLGDVRDVAVDSRGRIFVADGFFHRVQRYSPDGRFELGWFVPTAGVFALRTTDTDEVQVATARANKLVTYTGDGWMTSKTEWGQDHYSEYAAERETTGHMEIRGGFLPRVVDTRSGRTIVKTPWPKRLVAPPFPAFAYSFLGVGIMGLSELQSRRTRAAQALRR